MHTTIFPNSTSRIVCQLVDAAGRLKRRFHRDQCGTISILAVFAMMLLTILLGMIMNVGRQVDGKLRMQNAADAAAYSGGVVLTRGLNSLAFTNHLLSEVFTMTGILRTLHNRDAERYVPDILTAWQAEGPVLAGSTFPKFSALGNAIPAKADAEQKLVTAFGDWGAAVADGSPGNPNSGALPLMESILSQHLITTYQRAVVAAIPDMANQAAMTVANLNAQKNGQPDGRGPMTGILWRTDGQQLDASYLASLVTDPNVALSDPSAPNVMAEARGQRDREAGAVFGIWSSKIMTFFDYGAKMSRFSELWRNFAHAEMQQLLANYPDTNLPMVLSSQAQMPSGGTTLDYYEPQMNKYYTLLAVVYWGKGPDFFGGIFRSPIDSDPVAYSQLRVFVPTSRLVWQKIVPTSSSVPLGGPPGYTWPPNPSSTSGTATWVPGRQWVVSTDWDLWNQHWTCQLVPATHPIVATILSTPPPVLAPGQNPSFQVPRLNGVSPDDLGQISYH
jgi:hypothetical protein